MAGHVSSIPVDIVEGAIESICALTSMDCMKAFSYIVYRARIDKLFYRFDGWGVFDELIQDRVPPCSNKAEPRATPYIGVVSSSSSSFIH